MVSQEPSPKEASIKPAEILPGFLFLGSYDTASRSELLKAMGITHILNVRPKPCHNFMTTGQGLQQRLGFPYFEFVEDYNDVSVWYWT